MLQASELLAWLFLGANLSLSAFGQPVKWGKTLVKSSGHKKMPSTSGFISNGKSILGCEGTVMGIWDMGAGTLVMTKLSATLGI